MEQEITIFNRLEQKDIAYNNFREGTYIFFSKRDIQSFEETHTSWEIPDNFIFLN